MARGAHVLAQRRRGWEGVESVAGGTVGGAASIWLSRRVEESAAHVLGGIGPLRLLPLPAPRSSQSACECVREREHACITAADAADAGVVWSRPPPSSPPPPSRSPSLTCVSTLSSPRTLSPLAP
eukprot:1852793-Rhodomonas_salina.1